MTKSNPEAGSESHNAKPSGCRLLCSRLAYGLWLLTGGLVLGLAHGVAFVVCWLSVVAIPMAKVNQTAMWLLVHRPLEIEIYGGRSYPLEEILLCAYQATNYNYYRFQVQGLNVVLVSTSLHSFTRVCRVRARD